MARKIIKSKKPNVQSQTTIKKKGKNDVVKEELENSKSEPEKKVVDVLNKHLHYEFGGPWGSFLITVISPLLVFYLCACVSLNEGDLIGPSSITKFGAGKTFGQLNQTLLKFMPSKRQYVVYCLFVLFELFTAWVMPGVSILGGKIRMNNNVFQLRYKCNAYVSWYVLLGLITVLHLSKIFEITEIIDHYVQYFIVASIVAISISILTYVCTIWGISTMVANLLKMKKVARETPGGVRMTGNHMYDFFVGASLNPRIGPIDLKMFTEIRISWPILFMITVAALIKSYQITGRIRMELVNLAIGHFLYANACAKGEHYIPATWDIKYEKWGYMLIYWNLAGVPFFYGISSYFLSETIAGNNVSLPHSFLWCSLIVMIISYYIWDVSITQKCDYRQRCTISSKLKYNTRKTIWLLPYSFLDSYKSMSTKSGEGLLLSGIWGYARKPHYTLDLIMALSWSLNTGFSTLVPYIHPIFFIIMLLHRQSRDEAKCSAKYGSDWIAYKKRVPYLYIPYIY